MFDWRAFGNLFLFQRGTLFSYHICSAITDMPLIALYYTDIHITCNCHEEKKNN